MFEFDYITNFAKTNPILESYNFSSVCHALMDCGKREINDMYFFYAKMLTDKNISPQIFLPWKDHDSVQNIMIALNRQCSSSVRGILHLKCEIAESQLYRSLKHLLCRPDLNFGLMTIYSMENYRKLMKESVQI